MDPGENRILGADTWTLPKQALSACSQHDFPEPVACKLFQSTGCPNHDFYLKHKEDPCFFNVRLVSQTGEVAPFTVLDLAARSDWFATYMAMANRYNLRTPGLE